MKASTLILAGASLVAAAPQKVPSNVPINCAKANANYCMDGDIILRCNHNAMGTRSYCSIDLRGQPPTKGVASCWQSGEETGDAACAKNCVVYADKVFTLGADECTPVFIEVPENPHQNTTLVPTGTPPPVSMPSVVPPAPLPSPNGTIPQPPQPTGPVPTGSVPTGPVPTGPEPTGPEPTGPEPTGPEPTGEPTNVPQPPPTAPTEPVPVPTGGAAVVLPGAFLAGFGMVAAYLI